MMSRRYRSRLRARRTKGVLSDLNLTSLTDMFAFILAVLLKQYSAANVALKPPVGMELPRSISQELPQRFVTIDIQRNGVYFEKQLVQGLRDFVPMAAAADGTTLTPMTGDTLFVMRTLVKQKIDSGAIQSTTAVVRAERTAPFDIIWRVMYTARQLGFEEFQNLTQQQHTPKI